MGQHEPMGGAAIGMARILIVEDEANIFKLVRFRLNHLGHEVLWVQDGGQALEAARGQSPDLILLDIMIPVMDGFQVLEKLKADPETRLIPVIMLTARGHEQDVGGGLTRGADDYVVKPFNFPELIERVNTALTRHVR
jgi:two-component system, OmpR family, alkaline phosphatase synthesis response regulator PhoP